MKVIVAGGRDFAPTKEHELWLISQFALMGATEIVCGMARGADMFGYKIAKQVNIPVKEFPADWDKYGKRAGYLRNQQMADYADACILFPGGKGTQHMKDIAIKDGLTIIEYM